MKHQHQAPVQDLDKRLRFLDEHKRIGDSAGETADDNDDARAGEETELEDKSPSAQFFLTK